MKNIIDKFNLNSPIITCPHCGWQYHMSEIMMDVDFLGEIEKVIKTPEGKVDFILGEQPDFKNEYNCDNCRQDFEVYATVSLESKLKNGDQEYSTPLPNLEKSLFDEDRAEKE